MHIFNRLFSKTRNAYHKPMVQGGFLISSRNGNAVGFSRPRYRSKHKRTHKNFFGVYPQQQQKFERESLSKIMGNF